MLCGRPPNRADIVTKTHLVCTLLAVSLAAFASAQSGSIPHGPWTKQKVPDGWVMHETKNYQIQSEAGIEKAKRLGEHMETMNRVYRTLFRPDKDGAKRQVIKLLKDRNSYLAYNAPPSSAAYYSRTDREMVCYDTGKWSDQEAAPETGSTTPPATGEGAAEAGLRSKLERRARRLQDMMTMDILGCAAHEGWHQYFDWLVVSFVTLPSWVNEGMGDYFYTAAPQSGKGGRRKVELGSLNEGRLLVLKAAIAQGRFVPLSKLISMSKGEFYNDASVCYAEGWAFCQFLLHSGNAKYTKIIPNFVRFVKDDTNMEAVTQRAFKGIDLDAMEAEWKAWIATLKLDGATDPDDEDETEGEGPNKGEGGGTGESGGGNGK
jgi:hypothetical protein